jgi:ATP-dependent protease ClpP protease subunit
MLHQPTGAVRGGAADVEIEADQLVAVRERLNRIFAAATGQDLRAGRDTAVERAREFLLGSG